MMSANLSYTVQTTLSSDWQLKPPVAVVGGELLPKEETSFSFETVTNQIPSSASTVIFTPIDDTVSALPTTDKPKVLGELDTLAEKISDNTSNFWLALDVLEPMVNNFQGVLSVKNGLLLSALVPIVNLPLHQGNRQFLSNTPWGRITEFVLGALTWLPLIYSGAKEILSTTVGTYQQAQAATGNPQTAQSHALSRGMLETGLELMALVIGPYALMHLSDFLISESFYRSRALFELESKTFPQIMTIIKKHAEFSHEHAFIEKHGLEHKSIQEIEKMKIFNPQGELKLSGEEGLATKALFRRYQREEMKASRFLPELGITLTKRIPIMLRETWNHIPKVLRNEMPERVDSTSVLSRLGEALVKEGTETALEHKIKFERVKAYLKTQEFKLGGYKTISSLALLALWYLCIDPVINKLANSLLVPLMVKHTNRQLAKKGLPPYHPNNKKEAQFSLQQKRTVPVVVPVPSLLSVKA